MNWFMPAKEKSAKKMTDKKNPGGNFSREVIKARLTVNPPAAHPFNTCETR
jgi:hypothetical protein